MVWSNLLIQRVPSRSRTFQSSLYKVRARFRIFSRLPVEFRSDRRYPCDPSSGHPEYNAKIVNEVIAIRLEKGVFTKEFAEQSYEDANMHDDGLLIGWKMLAILGI